MYRVMELELWLKAKGVTTASRKNLFSKVSSTMLMEHFLCDDVGGKHNVCEMDKSSIISFKKKGQFRW